MNGCRGWSERWRGDWTGELKRKSGVGSLVVESRSFEMNGVIFYLFLFFSFGQRRKARLACGNQKKKLRAPLGIWIQSGIDRSVD